MTARVFIVDDHPLVRSGVRTELGNAVEVVGEAGDVEGAITALVALADDAVDVVLLDVHMPGGGGVEILRRVGPARPALRFLALSVSDAPEDVIAVIRAGARGYITKSSTGAELSATRTVTSKYAKKKSNCRVDKGWFTPAAQALPGPSRLPGPAAAQRHGPLHIGHAPTARSRTCWCGAA